MNASISEAFQTVTDSPNLNGFGNLPSRTQRHIVAGLTGSLPGLFAVVANSLSLIIRCDMRYPLKIRRSAKG